MGSRYSHSDHLYGDFDAFRQTRVGANFQDRLLQPSVLVSLAALLVTSIIWLRTPAQGSPLGALVTFIPYRLLYSVENWLHPPIAPRPMLLGHARTRAAKKELLVKILGMDAHGGGIMGSVSQASQRGLSSMSGAMLSLKGVSDAPPGLGNLDNSCYQNSILQGLASLRPLPPYLSEQLRGINLEERKNDATVNLRTLIEDLNSVSNNGRTIWTPPALKNMSTWQQQDAQEYFSKLLDEVDKEVAKLSKAKNSLPFFGRLDNVKDTPYSDDSGYSSSVSSPTASTSSKAPRNPLEGLVAQRVACVQCGHSDGLSMIPFNCLTLSLGVNAAEHDLYELLDAYANIESIEGVQCGKCTLLKVQRLLKIVIDRARAANASDDKIAEPLSRLAAVEEAFENDDYEDQTITEKCKVTPTHKVNSTKTKQTVVARAPQSLVVHMNRSVFDESTGYMWKNSAAVRFPKTLDLGPWCLGSAGTYTRVADDAARGGVPVVKPAHPDREEWLLSPRASMIAGDRGQSKVSGPLYELSAVITHYGRHENGHYVCYRKFPRSSPPVSTEEQCDAEERPESATNGTEDVELQAMAEGQSSASSDAPSNDEDTEMEWWRLSDETVHRVDEATVLAQGGVFMLFYDCEDPNSVLASEVDAAPTAAGSQVSAAPSTVGELSTCNSSATSESSDEPVTPTEPMFNRDIPVSLAGLEQASPASGYADVKGNIESESDGNVPTGRLDIM